MKILFLAIFVVVSEAALDKCRVTGKTFFTCVDAKDEDLPTSPQFNIQWLTFKRSTVKHVKSSLLKNFPQLTDFHAESTGIQKIDDDAFKIPKLIDWIDLSNNQIKSIHVDLLKGTKTSHFNISGNSGLAIPKNKPFLEADDLAWLDLQSCDISELYSETFSKLPKMRDLSLAYNKLKALPDDIFVKNVRLLSINISGNNFKFLNPIIFQNKRVLAATMGDNPWECDCKLSPLLSWSKRNVMKGNDVSCAKPVVKPWNLITNPEPCK